MVVQQGTGQGAHCCLNINNLSWQAVPCNELKGLTGNHTNHITLNPVFGPQKSIIDERFSLCGAT
uniref:Uncharacterized protein n=1 Tax=Anguilla anguilla TaxID=7936 RepID=A0A0E9XZX9_ANGAN